MTMNTLLETRALTVSIGGKQVCRELNLVVHGGERWGILGVNGVGKTTLLHTLAGLKLPVPGDVVLSGQSLAGMKRRDVARICGLMPQDSDDAFPATVMETALIGRHPHLPAWAWESAEDERIACSALESVGLAGIEQRMTHTLSGGERRRLALATLLVQNPALLLLDEPVNHLDLHHQIETLELLTEQALQHGKALVMVLHDVNLAARYCDRLLLLFGDGKVLQGKVDEVLNTENLARLYHHPVHNVEAEGRKLYYPA